MPLLTLSDLSARLKPVELGLKAEAADGPLRDTAVAAILRERSSRLEVLLMQRAVNPRDPWSGDACLPGGHRARADACLLATAIRETREEVGLDLGGAPVLGRLAPVRPFGRLGRLVVHPFVFALSGEAELRLGAEAVDTFWLPLDEAASGRLDARYLRWFGPVPIWFSCWRHEGRVVWGLTLMMLRTLVSGFGHAP